MGDFSIRLAGLESIYPVFLFNGSHNVYHLHEKLIQKSSRSTRRIEEFCFYLVKADKRDF